MIFINFDWEQNKKDELEEEDASERIFINSELKLNEKHALGEEGCFREDIHEF